MGDYREDGAHFGQKFTKWAHFCDVVDCLCCLASAGLCRGGCNKADLPSRLSHSQLVRADDPSVRCYTFGRKRGQPCPLTFNWGYRADWDYPSRDGREYPGCCKLFKDFPKCRDCGRPKPWSSRESSSDDPVVVPRRI